MRHKMGILAGILALLLLSGCAATGTADVPGSGAPELSQSAALPEPDPQQQPQAEPAQTPAEESPAPPDAAASATPKPADAPEPAVPEEIVITPEVNTCTVSINCATVLDNLDALPQGKEELVPADGWLLAPVEVEFNEGESVFHVLSRICRQEKIHMEFEDTPVYNSAYIEGIGNLYEFDCGPLSGWKYRVNGWFPNYGCSQYQLSSGDVVEWLYTCDLGADVGGGESQ